MHAALQNGATGAAAPVKDIMSAIPGIDLDPDRVALHRRQGRQPARRADVQLVRGRPHRPAVGGQPADELATVPRHHDGWLADVDHQADVRADTRRPALDGQSDHARTQRPGLRRDSAARSDSTAQYRCARTTSAARRGPAGSAARTTAGWVTTAVRTGGRSVASQPAPHPGNQVDNRFAAVRGAAAASVNQTASSAGSTPSSTSPRQRPQSRSASRESVSARQSEQLGGLAGALLRTAERDGPRAPDRSRRMPAGDPVR